MEPMQLQRLLRNSANEIKRLSGVAQDLDDVLGSIPHEAVASQMGALQNVDMLRQSLEALGAFVGSLADEVDDEAQIDPGIAAAQIKLRDLRAACLADPGNGP
ncbi:hypothetical protein E0K89_003210 [Aquicoccus sp. SCR17]|nr:hypothetical protein [Carideicomes alvinocaridis]